MLLLMLFALVAGAGTAITPCVLPVLPALLSASALGGRRRPVGIVLGLALAFTLAIVALAQLVRGVGLASGAARTLAVLVLIGFGVALLVPSLAARVQAPLSRLARFGPKTRGDGFWSGLGVGAALGFVCAPCAGPILAAVTSVSAQTGPSIRIVLVAASYSAGLSAVMLLYGFGGRAALARVRRVARGHVVERSLGAILLVTGVAMVFNLDVRFEEALARNGALPSFLVDPTSSLENSAAVQKRLAALRPESRYELAQMRTHLALPELGPAPEFRETQRWFNTPGGRPLTLHGLRGHVVLVDFWTYTCINCIRTLPFVEGLYRHYHRDGLEVIGVETPEFTFEQEAGNVAQAIRSDGITYPVVQDNRYGTWNAYQNQYWPAEYYVDARGQVRHTSFGEGGYLHDEQIVRALLRAAGARTLPAAMTARALTPSANLGTPETYLDPQRSQGFVAPLLPGLHDYTPAARNLALNSWALGGTWRVGSESITPAGPAGSLASITGAVQARDVYLVMTSTDGRPQRGRVLLGGQPIPARYRGTDVGPGGWFTVRAQRLYDLVALPRDATFQIRVELPPGISAYDFTFG
jgi:cytochrome c biogenesis protein CcdA/thiol-disulfide isomerase/thioredoxin